ncbi:DUF1540 domain-containing protein [Clostridium prolinivorans]|uniref:DUF1540 domain-containing protein n=1 Tax=Clostridium prolinivorans TaxID=2769420 RepID=UPI000FDAEAFF|nr:DUF1540 domain-containing protein [Clostridium prolinivorans]
MSGKLSCNALNCVNNVNGLCSANVIHVIGAGAHNSRETMCNTFAPKGFINAVTNLPNMNVVGEIKQVFTTESIEMSPSIKCEAINCKYNESRKCKSLNIQVIGSKAGSSEETQCETFKIE